MERVGRLRRALFVGCSHRRGSPVGHASVAQEQVAAVFEGVHDGNRPEVRQVDASEQAGPDITADERGGDRHAQLVDEVVDGEQAVERRTSLAQHDADVERGERRR